MNEVVHLVNSFFAGSLNILLWPFKSVSPVWGLSLISAIAGVVLLYFFGLISNQKAIRETKQKIHASLLETVLFRHDLRLCLKAQGRMLKGAGKYFILALIPLAVLSIPCIYLLGHLNSRYNERTLKVGEPVIIGVETVKGKDLGTLSLNVPQGLQEEASVKIPGENQIVYRMKASQAGALNIEIKDNSSGMLYAKPIYVALNSPALQSKSYTSSLWSLLYPGGEITGKAKDALSAVWVNYPLRELSLFGFEMHWVLIFLIISLVSGLLASRFMGIEI